MGIMLRSAGVGACVQDAANRGSIKTVQVKGPASSWQSMNNVWGASWEMTSVPKPPLDIRIQDDTGTEVASCPPPGHQHQILNTITVHASLG